ncbi:MAG: hypothetical protein O7D30_13105, partial [Rickettsia endosymbiont of Ixodes persulcatus]|nr:hypothetical protein [Rickettsia endosymbiont of Ixodes persulcatus]
KVLIEAEITSNFKHSPHISPFILLEYLTILSGGISQLAFLRSKATKPASIEEFCLYSLLQE